MYAQPPATKLYFHAAPIILGVGSTILPGNFWRIRSKFEADWRKRYLEEVFESVRASEFKALPSRQSCVFMSETLHGAQEFAHETGRHMDVLYEVTLTDPEARLHRTNYNLVNANLSPPDLVAQARLYWACVPSERVEVLAPCPVKITRCIGPVLA